MGASEIRDILTAAIVRTVVPNFERNMQRFLAYKEKYNTGFIPADTTKTGKRLMQEISQEFVNWGVNTRIALRQIEEGAPLPHKGITQRKLDRLNKAGFETRSTTGDTRGKGLGGKKQMKYDDLLPFIEEYAAEHNGKRPAYQGRVMREWAGSEFDLGKAVGNRLGRIQRGDTIREIEKFSSLFRRFGWLDSENGSEISKDSADE
jgi:hypothetical protein